MQVTKTIPRPDESPAVSDVPAPALFREWVQDCLAILGVSAASVSRDLDLGRNTVGDFLAKTGRGINLSTAHVLTCKLREIASAKGVSLPRLGGARNV